MDGLEPDFLWDDYLEDTESKAVPADSFIHVEQSLVSSFSIGMKLEVLNPEQLECYWIASIVMTCGPLLSLRYLGYGEDRSADFWFDVNTKVFHPVGWCTANGQKLIPPKGVLKLHSNYMDLLSPELEKVDSVPIPLDASSGITPIDQIKCGMLVEVSDAENFEHVWPCRIVQNVGGRLLLQYHATSTNFWVYYLSQRVHSVGWASMNGLIYTAPSGDEFKALEQEDAEKLSEVIVEENDANPFPDHVLEAQLELKDHGFEEGMKLEVLNTLTLTDIRPATVTKVISSEYFVVEVDNLETKSDVKVSYPPLCCSSLTDCIFACNWAQENGLEIFPPDGYEQPVGSKFDWNQYLEHCEAQAAPKDLFDMSAENFKFEVGMKLEAVNPFDPKQIHVATVEKVVQPLIWLSMDSISPSSVHHATTPSACDIFPVGWCMSNSYPLQAPVLPKMSSRSKHHLSIMSQAMGNNGVGHADKEVKKKDAPINKSWCPKIYFNHCCFTGPYLSKGNLAELPQAIGPGPIELVMKDVLTRLINIAYKSSRVLKELQMKGRPNPKMFQQNIKAKYKGKSYRATVEFVQSSEHVEEFCRSICVKLDCCPYLFGPTQVGKECPENCHKLTKTKFGYAFLMKQKKLGITNPTTVEAPTSDGRKKCGRKKKRKHWRLLQSEANASHNKKEEVCDNDNNENDEKNDENESKPNPTAPSCRSSEESAASDNEKVQVVKRRRKKAVGIVKTQMVTRGARLPNFWNDRRWRHHNTTPPFLKRRGRPPVRVELQKKKPQVGLKKKGRPFGSTRKIQLPETDEEEEEEDEIMDITEESPKNGEVTSEEEEEEHLLESNPLEWSAEDVAEFMRKTNCAPVSRLLREQEIDGTALLLLTMNNVREFLYLNMEPAQHLCTLVENLRCEYFKRFAA